MYNWGYMFMLYYAIVRKIYNHIKKVLMPKTPVFASFGYGSIIDYPYLQIKGLDKVSIGENSVILSGARICVFGEGNEFAIEIGDECYICYGVTILGVAGRKIKIGNNVLFASNIFITNECHGMNPESQVPYMSQPLTGLDVEIGDGCWLGEKVCVLPGVKIGKKCIIGAGSVVTKSIPDYSIAVGNPARVVKKYDFTSHKWKKVSG